MTTQATTAVVMARGLGTRMRREDPNDGTGLSAGQLRAATAGIKSMIPDYIGRPFLDHILSSLADGGIREVILVVAPEHELIREHYAAHPPRRVSLQYAVQQEALGTADAILAAESSIGGRAFLACNADNLYPVAAVSALVNLTGAGVVAFDRATLVSESNIDEARVATFAILSFDDRHRLDDIIEKPGIDELQLRASQWIGMNIWRFDTAIFTFCREVPISARGERELPQAVALGIRNGLNLRVVEQHAGVLDLSNRGDIESVSALLATRDCNP